mmetsp:Transcript_2721/g.10652  ORF Transcript_2721/g.10652 Transcript_2721/m.10652 type:complete len:248 (-) Transcript_2721:76-819(-)
MGATGTEPATSVRTRGRRATRSRRSGEGRTSRSPRWVPRRVASWRRGRRTGSSDGGASRPWPTPRARSRIFDRFDRRMRRLQSTGAARTGRARREPASSTARPASAASAAASSPCTWCTARLASARTRWRRWVGGARASIVREDAGMAKEEEEARQRVHRRGSRPLRRGRPRAASAATGRARSSRTRTFGKMNRALGRLCARGGPPPALARAASPFPTRMARIGRGCGTWREGSGSSRCRRRTARMR